METKPFQVSGVPPRPTSTFCRSTPPTNQSPEASESKAPDVYRFQNYREYLKAWLEFKKQTQRDYSGAVFARKAGLQSHTLLGMVIRGDRNLGYETIRAFARALGLKGSEKIYFEKLVLFNQAKSSDDRSDFFDQLVSLAKGNEREMLTHLQQYAQYCAHWYVLAVRELVLLTDFVADAGWIAAKLKGRITKKQAQAAWDTLLSLEMISWDAEASQYRQTHPVIDIDLGVIDFALRKFHKEFLNLAHDAVEQESMAERELSSLTLALSQSDLLDLKKKITDFRKHINLKYSAGQSGTPPDHVVALNMQLLILTKEGESP